MRALSPLVFEARAELCLRCPSPCARQKDVDFQATSCAKCPLPRPRWANYGPCVGIDPASKTAGASSAMARPVMPNEPSVADLARNFATATAKWADAGFPVAGSALYDARTAICEACDLWDAGARLGLGKCNHPDCGCTKFKRWMKTERCPLGRWPQDASALENKAAPS